MTPTPLSVAGSSASWGDSWASALDAMEMDVAETEALLLRLHAEADWTPSPRTRWELPTGLGLLPTSLADRARALLERQQQAAVELTRAMVGNRRQQKAAASVDQRPAATPVYIDTAV